MATKQSGGWLKWTVVFFVIVVIAAGGVWYFNRGGNDAPQYQTAPVARGDLTQVVTATGSLNPVVNVTVGSQVSGRIIKLNVNYNATVTSNEVIAEIDPSTYQAAVEQATADLANAKANLELQQVEANRSDELFTNKLISGSDHDTAIATLHEAEAMVKIKQASLNNALVNLNYCKILSPVDGVVISRAVDLGQTVASSFNTPTLFQIANDLTKMQIDTAVAEADIGGIMEGQSAEFGVDAYPERTFYGAVTQVRNSPTNSANVISYDGVIGVTNADYKLKPGMTANVSIPNGALRYHPPEGALGPTNSAAAQAAPATNGGNFAAGSASHRVGHRGGERPVLHTVYVLAGEGKDANLQAVQIKTGISDGISTEVVSGLDEGALVVTSMALTGTAAAKSTNPLGGGFPRMR
jgi:HlyD family secretion protein